MAPQALALIGLLSLGVLAAPVAGYAQGKVHRIGYLDPAPLSWPSPTWLRTALGELGWFEKRNFVFEVRSANYKLDRLTAYADELARLKVDVIVTRGTDAALAAKRATGTIPIVFLAVADPVGAGLVTNLARPEGNVTGLTDATEQTAAKQLELLKEALPRLSRVEVLWLGAVKPNEVVWGRLLAAGRELGIQLGSTAVPDRQALERALGTLRRSPPGAALVLGAEWEAGHMTTLGDFALKQRLPMASNAAYLAWSGGLMSYTRSSAAETGRAAQYVDRILRGARPGELPVEQPTTFDLLLNTTTAKTLGLKLPPSLVFRATQVIE
jgi:putative ABC transport system substrate-binding protein